MWAAMRDRRLLSARGHPDRLKEGGEEKRTKERGEREGQAEEEGDGQGRVSECERIEREEREEEEVSKGKSRMQGIPRSFRKKRTDGKEVNY